LVVTVLVGCSAAMALAPSGCSASDSASKNGVGGGSGSGGGGGLDGGFGCGACLGNRFTECDAAGNKTEVDCGTKLCATSKGCLDCLPNGGACVGNDVHTCTAEGKPGDFVETCDVSAGEICNEGVCKKECDVVDGAPSNVGCEFWAVDLPNERGLDKLGFKEAAAEPWGVVLSNAGVGTAQVTIERNNAAPGQPLALETVHTATIAAGELQVAALPRAEVTGWTPATADPPGPPGSFLTSNGFRITSTAPLVVYQFNNFTNNYSNDASLLMPRNGLGSLYRVLGHPTANPISFGGVAGIPDRTSVTIVGVSANTTVKVIVGTTTVADGNGLIPPLAKGGSFTITIGPFDVVNVSSDGIPGDMTGTIVESSQPVAVFSSGERIGAPYLDPPPPPPPGFDPQSNCCTDHFEEQMFPVTSLGRQFVISRSPVRSTGGYAEPDVLRFLGVAAPAQVKTNLPPPFDDFSLLPGELKETWTDRDIVVDSSEPITIGQILVSAGFTTSNLGDPSLTIFPAIEQYRNEYQFLIPPSWSSNHFVIAAKKGGSYVLDGQPLPGSCLIAPAGNLGGDDYEAIRCQVGEGTHRVSGNGAFGLTVYGWGNVGSYAFAGGADVKPIYDPPPIPY
jgi:hypothetical protein